MARNLTKADYIGDCDKCSKLSDLKKRSSEVIDMKELKQLQNHFELAIHQQTCFKTQRNNLSKDQCLIVQVKIYYKNNIIRIFQNFILKKER